VKIEGKRVLVTGGAGFIGSHLVDLLAPVNDVTVLDDFSVGTMANLREVESRVRVLQADVTDAAAVARAVAQSQVIFHLAVVCLRVSIGDPMRSHLTNDLGTLNLLMAARNSSIERIVHVSSSEVYGNARWVPMDEDHPLDPTTPYGASKAAADAYALSFHHTYGMPVTVVRPFNSYGPREHLHGPSGEVIPKFVARALAGKPLLVFGDGLQTRSFTWVADVVRGIKLAGECDALVGSAVNIARPEEVSILAVAHHVRRLLGGEVQIVHREPRPGDVRRHIAGVDRARRLLGFSAGVGIEEGLTRYLAWVRSVAEEPNGRLERDQELNWEPAAQAV
jgi:UDP-glucose 4-epimerase